MTGMKIYPAIDLLGGKVVRLEQGDFLRRTDYPLEPLEAARRFRAAGAACLHVVDLEVLNDFNRDVITLYRVVQHHIEEFIRYFRWMLVSRDEFDRI